MHGLERVIFEARQLRERMSVFPPLGKPICEMIFAVSKYAAYPDNGFVDVELVAGPYLKCQFPSMTEYWDYVCGILQDPKASMTEKAKALLGFDRTIATYYLRNVTDEQWGTYQRVYRLLLELVVHHDMPPCIVYYRPLAEGEDKRIGVGGPKNELNAQSLEARIFLDKDELKKLYTYTTQSGWGNGVPYRTRIFNVNYIQVA
jgi:hypothetical protein